MSIRSLDLTLSIASDRKADRRVKYVFLRSIQSNVVLFSMQRLVSIVIIFSLAQAAIIIVLNLPSILIGFNNTAIRGKLNGNQFEIIVFDDSTEFYSFCDISRGSMLSGNACRILADSKTNFNQENRYSERKS